MLLTVDIGNSSTKFAFVDDGEIIDRIRIPTERDSEPNDILSAVDGFNGKELSGIAISSVVRELRGTYRALASNHLNLPVLFCDHDSDLLFSINYDPPEDCGPDRLVAAHAAVQIAGSPVIVCDLGTATTIDLVTAEAVYSGGIIAPGIETMANSLFDNTSRLPKVDVGAAHRLVGNSTERSIRSGIYFGYIGLVDGIIGRMQSQLEDLAPVIATGGFAELISKESRFVNEIDRDLIHRGLFDIWTRHHSRSQELS